MSSRLVHKVLDLTEDGIKEAHYICIVVAIVSCTVAVAICEASCGLANIGDCIESFFTFVEEFFKFGVFTHDILIETSPFCVKKLIEEPDLHFLCRVASSTSIFNFTIEPGTFSGQLVITVLQYVVLYERVGVRAIGFAISICLSFS